MADHQDDILAAGAEIVWVLEADARGTPGTAALCVDVVGDLGGSVGWCVGDAQTEPTPLVFDDSPFSEARGFDMIVNRATMEVLWVSTHGSTSGNENLDGAGVAAAVEAAVAGR